MLSQSFQSFQLFVQQLYEQHSASQAAANANRVHPAAWKGNHNWRLLWLGWHHAAHTQVLHVKTVMQNTSSMTLTVLDYCCTQA